MMLRNGADTPATVAMSLLRGDGQTILHGNPAGIRIHYFNEELVDANAAV